MRKLTLIFILQIVSPLFTVLNAQTTKIDSLENLLQKHTSKDTTRVNLLNEIALTYHETNNSDEVLKYAEEAGKLASELNFLRGEFESLYLTGDYFSQKNEYKTALEYYQKALEVAEKLSDKKEIANCFYKIGFTHYSQSNYSDALVYFKKALEIRKKFDDISSISNTHNSLGVIYRYQGNYAKAIDHFNESLRLSVQENDKEGVSMSYNNIGIVYSKQGNYSKALEYYQKSLKLKEAAGNKKGVASAYQNIGDIYEQKEEYDKALEYYQEALRIKIEIDYQKGIYFAYHSIGVIYRFKGNYKKALENYEKALKISRKLDYPAGISSLLLEIGKLNVHKGEFSNALENYQQSLKISLKTGEKHLQVGCYIELALLYSKQNKLEKAYRYSKKAYLLSSELGNVNLLKKSSEILARICNTKGLYKEAYNYYVVFKTMNDSIFNKENTRKITSLELEYKFEKEKQATELAQQKKDAIAIKEIKFQKTIKNVFIAGLFVALLVILLFYRIVRIKKKANNLLQQKNEEIILQKDLISEQKTEIQTQADELLEHKTNLEAIVEQRTAAFIKAKEQAEESDQLKTAFLNNISHEFRTPINGILGFSILLINSESEENKKKYADIVNQSCDQLLNIVNDTVEISKVHSAQAKIIKSTVNVLNIISEIINEFKESAVQKGIDISLELKLEKEQLLIELDAHKIERVFWHLIDNAMKFTYRGHIRISGQEIENNYIQFQVEDTGIGILPELKEKIFDPFRQVETGASRNFGGNGIGLSLAKAYIEMMGGEISLESQIEKGTSIFFTIPMQKSVKVEQKKQNITTRDINNKTILIAEDNELNFILIREILFNYNIKLFHAWNGKEALKIFIEQKNIDLILMDLKMPVMDGYESLKTIKEINPRIPVIAQTAYASDMDREAINVAGFDDYITKPINGDKLVQMMKQQI